LKANLQCSVDVDVLKKIRDLDKFNVSAFVEQKLRELLEEKGLFVRGGKE